METPKQEITLKIYKYDTDINQFVALAEIDRFESFIYQFNFFVSNKGTLKININEEQLDEIIKYLDSVSWDLENNILCFYNAEHPDENGVFNAASFESGEQKQQELLVLRGTDWTGLTRQRITYPSAAAARHEFSSTAEEDIMHGLIDKNLINPHELSVGEGLKRKVSFLELAASSSRGSVIDYGTRFKQLEEELKFLTISSGIGMKSEMIAEDIGGKDRFTKIRISFFEGLDRTEDGAEPLVRGQRALFSLALGNLKRQKFIIETENTSNVGIGGGQGEGLSRDIVVEGLTEDFARRERFFNFSSVPAGNLTELSERVNSELDDLKTINYYEGELNPNSNLEFRTDFYIGDIVTAKFDRIKLTADVRIISVVRIYQPHKIEHQISFGTEDFEFNKFLKTEFRASGREQTK